MSNSDRTPLLEGDSEAPPSPTFRPHHDQHLPSTSVTTPAIPITSSLQDSEDAGDGMLFNNSPHLTGRSGTPEAPHHKGQHEGQGRTLPAHLRPPQDAVDIQVYTRRFWILGWFSFLAMFQCLMWNTWGPLSASVNAAYPGWGSGTVAMMGNWGTITFVLFVAPMCWLMSTHGLRAGVLLCAVLIAGGVVLRVLPLLFTDNVTFFTVMCHVCAILVGTAGTLICAAPPFVAAIWFPPKERTTATAFSQMFNSLGNTGSYLEPLLVREPSSDPSPEEVAEIQGDIKRLMYIWAGVGAAALVVVFAYFPSKPPTPPSLTSHVERLDFREGLKLMVRNRELLLITLAYGFCVGVPLAWSSVLNFSLYELGMTQVEASYVGMAATFTCSVLALVSGRLTDMVYGHIKLTLIVIVALDTVFFYWFFLLTWGSIPVTTWQIYVTVVCGMALNFATSPLFFELAVESAYPCNEVMVGGIMAGCNNFVGLCFLFLFFVPFQSYQWVTYVLLATLGLSLLPFMFIKENYSRSNIDRADLDLASAYDPI